MERTAQHLRRRGIEVDIRLSGDRIEYSDYDLMHFFNLIRPADVLVHAENSGKPYVISTIFLDYGEFEKKNRTGWTSLFGRLFSADQVEYIKAIGRYLRNGEAIQSGKYLAWGHSRSIRYLIRHARILLPNSEHEYERLLSRYGVIQDYVVVPNAIDEDQFRSAWPPKLGSRDRLLCVGRIEQRKNQLNLIRAVKNSPYTLTVLGVASPNNEGYYRKCLAEATPNIRFIGRLTEEDLFQLYGAARVHILASHFETTGLASLEAAVMGCNVVITGKGDTREYFGDLAYYCDPEDPSSIRAAIDQAYRSPYPEALRHRILEKFTWEKAAERTEEAYLRALAKKC